MCCRVYPNMAALSTLCHIITFGFGVRPQTWNVSRALYNDEWWVRQAKLSLTHTMWHSCSVTCQHLCSILFPQSTNDHWNDTHCTKQCYTYGFFYSLDELWRFRKRWSSTDWSMMMTMKIIVNLRNDLFFCYFYSCIEEVKNLFWNVWFY